MSMALKRSNGQSVAATEDGGASSRQDAWIKGRTKGKTITIIVADDHRVVRDGIRMILSAEPDMEVVAEVGDAEEARRRTSGLKPTVLVLDLNMPGPASLDLIPVIADGSPETAIVVLTMQNDPVFARRAFASGARGYVVKHSAGVELVGAVRRVVDGGTYVNPELGARIAVEPEGPPGGLTPRESEILGLIALGYTNPEIAERLVVSVRTVETHRSGIQRKLGTSNRAELVRFAREHRLIED
jgi:two-component system response regulator NreC